MREYETVYVLKPELTSDLTQGLQEKIADIIQKQEGKVLSQADWGKRKLAYRVQKFRHGQYFYLQFLDKGAAISEIERILKYDDKVLRFLTVKVQDEVNVEERLSKPIPTPPAPEEYYQENLAESGFRDRYEGGGRRSFRGENVEEAIVEPLNEPLTSGSE